MSVSLFLFCKYVHLHHFFYISHRSYDICYLSFSLWLTLINMVMSRSIHIAADGIVSLFLLPCNISLCIYIYIYHIFLIHISVIVNSAAVNTGVHVSFWIGVFFAQEWDINSKDTIWSRKEYFSWKTDRRASITVY